MKSNPSSRTFAEVANSLLDYLEQSIWPLQLDVLIYAQKEEQEFEERAQGLLDFLERRPALLAYWLSAVSQWAPAEDGASDRVRALTGIRVLGPQRARIWLIALRLAAVTEMRPSLDAPLPFWKEWESVLGSEEREANLRVELATLVAVFMAWVQASSGPAALNRASSGLSARFPYWARIWKRLQSESKDNAHWEGPLVLRLGIILDLGQLALSLERPEAESWWAEGAEKSWPIELRLQREAQGLQVSSAQLAALWALVFARLSALATPLRALMPPWKLDDSMMMAAHSRAARKLLKVWEGVAE
jgi:hypothetical protein